MLALKRLYVETSRPKFPELGMQSMQVVFSDRSESLGGWNISRRCDTNNLRAATASVATCGHPNFGDSS